MDYQAAIETLELFIEKVTKLQGMKFTQWMLNEASGLRISLPIEAIQSGPVLYGPNFRTLSVHLKAQHKDIHVERFGPDEEARDAFLLTYRLVCRDSGDDGISLRQIAELCESLPVDPDLLQKIGQRRSEFNAVLAAPLTLAVTFNGRNITRAEIFDVFLWGGTAHANRRKKKMYDEWAKYPQMFATFDNEFIAMLGNMLAPLLYTRDACKRIVEELRERETSEAS